MNQDSRDTEKKSTVARQEEEILEFWNKNGIFKKSEEKEAPKGEYVFYDGPPFASGLPHYGHLLAGTIKDAIPRYRSMQGWRVRRRWGWDCHGLPVENMVEKELGLETKKDILGFGIEPFNETARRSIMRDADVWKKVVPRMGRFVDMEQDYKTMDTTYTESVWWAFKELHTKGLVYEGFKVMHLCPRCGTTLSNFEVNLGYKDTDDISVYVKFPLNDEPDTFLIAWTTTPWTLPGNMALAINRDVTYVKARVDETTVILAQERLSALEKEYTILETFKGERLIGKSYTPPFDYYTKKDIKGKVSHIDQKTQESFDRAWKVYHADYVSVEDGTGVVHIAPAFGEEDLSLAQKEGIPIVHHVTVEGVFGPDVKDFAGMAVKPKDEPQKADIEIVKYLAHHNLLFKKQKITHSYPFCWRCDTPLLNYATSSWFVKVTSLKNKLVSENKKIGWVPKDVGENRFGNWLENARDWAISRSRYWGAPLPIWRNEKKKTYVALGSIEELKKYTKKSGNRYFLMRHGQAKSNGHFVESKDLIDNPLTKDGVAMIEERARTLSHEKIDLIFVSPLLRTQQTAGIMQRAFGLPDSSVIVDLRLRELDVGNMNGKTVEEWDHLFKTFADRFTYRGHGGEDYTQVRERVGDFLFDIERKYSGKNILMVSHGTPLWLMGHIMHKTSCRDILNISGAEKKRDEDCEGYPKTGELNEISFVPFPHNATFELDLHRPYIDGISLVDSDGEPLIRVPDVFDCWFESGSMPYAQYHYPFENKDVFEPRGGWFSRSKGYPAHFIAEGLDQTRGWFYSLLVLGVALFGKTPYQNVIVNGLVLSEDGKKMSKRLKNYPDPMYIIDTYGADALRFYLLSSPAVHGEDLQFFEKGVDEVLKKLIVRLSNVLSFYELYKDESTEHKTQSTKGGAESTHVLDRWILTRANELIKGVTEGMEKYELDRATRPINDFIDDLSTWYLRRSRERFKGEDEHDKQAALLTTRRVLIILSKVMAPFMPFYAEYLYRRLRSEGDQESVHLSTWPQIGLLDQKLLTDMQQTRTIVSLGLELRAKEGIKVRQPLQSLRLGAEGFRGIDKAHAELIKDEMNVKEVIVDDNLEEGGVRLDTTLTDELRNEGTVREFIRHIQQLRKNENLTPHDTVRLSVDADDELQRIIRASEGVITKTALLSEIVFDQIPEGVSSVIDGHEVKISIG